MISILLLTFNSFLIGSDCRNIGAIQYNPISKQLLFEGDIIVDEEARFFVDYPGYKWPNFIVPYKIHQSLANRRDAVINIYKAMEQYHNYTCLKFVPALSANEHYLNITDGSDCSAYVGRMPKYTDQAVTLNYTDCNFVGTVVHELGHAIGLHHEHQRPDRDYYITIYKNNVGNNLLDFELENDYVVVFGDYHYDSIMHYGNYAFSGNRKKTMDAKNGQKLLDPYDKPGLTVIDMIRINTFYDCPHHVNHPRV